MKPSVAIVLVSLSLPSLAGAQAKSPATAAPPTAAVKYGANASAGRTFTHDGVKLYYEVYGTGEPLLMVHGNGGSLSDLRGQIAHFRTRYMVIAMDSRDHGRSADSAETITYEEMTDDLAALLEHLKVGPVNVLGWSDGGIEALLLGIRHPAKVKKLVAMAANLNPTEDAFSAEVLALIKSMMADMPAAARDTAEGKRAVIRDEHTIDIFHHVPNSQLAIFPNATHMIPFDDPATFNATVERFLRTPFVKRERIKDTMTSLEKMKKAS